MRGASESGARHARASTSPGQHHRAAPRVPPRAARPAVANGPTWKRRMNAPHVQPGDQGPPRGLGRSTRHVGSAAHKERGGAVAVTWIGREVMRAPPAPRPTLLRRHGQNFPGATARSARAAWRASRQAVEPRQRGASGVRHNRQDFRSLAAARGKVGGDVARIEGASVGGNLPRRVAGERGRHHPAAPPLPVGGPLTFAPPHKKG